MRAQAKLQACRYREVRQTICTFERGVLLLRGEVSSYHLKQIAQSVLMKMDGVTRIENQIHVRP
jgi:osmotically-inducible protein OsmY